MQAFSFTKENPWEICKERSSLRCQRSKASLSKKNLKEKGTWRKVSPLKKGVSLMISAVILIAITVTIGLITADFLSKTSKQRTEQIRDIAKDKLDCQFANLYIRNASLNCNNNCSSGVSHTFSVTVVNSGKRTVKIDNLYIRNNTGNLFTFYANGTKELNASDVLTITNTSTIACGDFNRTIDRVIVSSNNCPNTAFDALPGRDVVFQSCG